MKRIAYPRWAKKDLSEKSRYTTAQNPATYRCFLPDLAGFGSGSLHRTWTIRKGHGTEREGFEPSVLFRAHTPSKRAPSTTRTSLQKSKRAKQVIAIPERGGFALRAASVPCILAFARRGLRIESPLSNTRQGVLRSVFCRKAFKCDTGERGIRTPDTLRYNGFRDRPIQPLSHLSKKGKFAFPL